MNSILVIRGGAIGDFILTLPAIKALREAYPAARLEILGYEHIISLAVNRFYAEHVRSIEAAELARFFARDSALPGKLAEFFARFDLIVSYLYDPDSIFETNLRRAGARNVTRGPARIGAGAHATQQLACPIETLGLPISDFAPRVHPSGQDRDFADRFLHGLAEPIVAFHPGSGSERKNWPLQSWIDLGNHFLTSFEGSLVIVGGEADIDRIARLESTWSDRRIRFAKNLPLTQLAAILERTVFVGHDSGVSHLAAATGAKSILLFGPTDAAVWAPLNQNARVIRAPDGNLERLDNAVVRTALDYELMRIGIST